MEGSSGAATTLDSPPSAAVAGGLNSALTVSLPGCALAPGQSLSFDIDFTARTATPADPPPRWHAGVMATRLRRTTETIRSRVLQAAQELFGERGYAGTSTREIAARAEVSEPLLFRHYGTKANLFEEAVLTPLERFIASYTERWSAETVHDGEAGDLARAYVGGLYDLLQANRGMVMATLTAHAYHYHLGEPASAGRPAARRRWPAASALDDLFGRLEDLVRRGWSEQGWPTVDPALAVRLTFGLVMSAAVFDTWLFPAGELPSRDRVVDELTEYMLRGLTARSDREVRPPI